MRQSIVTLCFDVLRKVKRPPPSIDGSSSRNGPAARKRSPFGQLDLDHFRTVIGEKFGAIRREQSRRRARPPSALLSHRSWGSFPARSSWVRRREPAPAGCSVLSTQLPPSGTDSPFRPLGQSRQHRLRQLDKPAGQQARVTGIDEVRDVAVVSSPKRRPQAQVAVPRSPPDKPPGPARRLSPDDRRRPRPPRSGTPPHSPAGQPKRRLSPCGWPMACGTSAATP